MNKGMMKQEIFPYFSETQDKIRNNDIGAKDRWRFVRHPRCEHPEHPCNGPPEVGVAPRCGGGKSKCEIPD